MLLSILPNSTEDKKRTLKKKTACWKKYGKVSLSELCDTNITKNLETYLHKTSSQNI